MRALALTRHRALAALAAPRRVRRAAAAAAALPPPPAGTTRVAVLAGFLGAGKTTTLAGLLNDAASPPAGVRVVVNDVGAVNIDAALLAAGVAAPPPSPAATATPFITPLTAGCACCTLADELTAAVSAAAADAGCGWLLVECTGVASPGPVAAAVAAAGDGVDLAAVVTVVDAVTFADAVAGRGGVAAAAAGHGNDDDSAAAVAELLADQVEGADIILLNKADAATPAQLAAAEAAARALNPGATLHTTTRGALPADALTAAAGAGVPGWVAALDAAAEARRGGGGGGGGTPSSAHEHAHAHAHHHHHAAAPTFTTFAYHADRPFHPARLLAALEADAPWKGVLRSKGFFWLASRPAIAGAWHGAGGGWAGEPSHAWDADAPATDVVFIGGGGMDRGAIVAALDAALVTDGEVEAGPAAWAAFDDPLPAWEVEEDEE